MANTTSPTYQAQLQTAEANLKGCTVRHNHAKTIHEDRRQAFEAARAECHAHPYLHLRDGQQAESKRRIAHQNFCAIASTVRIMREEVREAQEVVKELKSRGQEQLRPFRAGPVPVPEEFSRPVPRAQAQASQARQPVPVPVPSQSSRPVQATTSDARSAAREQKRLETLRQLRELEAAQERERNERARQEREKQRSEEEWKQRQKRAAEEASRARRQQREERQAQRTREREEESRRKYWQWAQKEKGANVPLSAYSTSSPAIEPVYTAWKKQVDAAFGDYAAMESFPAPPVSNLCAKSTCVAGKGERVLPACACDVQRAFRVLGLSAKEERLRWHPDRFSKCADRYRESFQAKAKEVFVVLDTMYKQERDRNGR